MGDTIVTCRGCGDTLLYSQSVSHPDGYQMCFECFWVEMEERMDNVIASDYKFAFLSKQRISIIIYIAGHIGRQRALILEPEEVLRAYCKDMLDISISNPPENRRAKIGKVTWI